MDFLQRPIVFLVLLGLTILLPACATKPLRVEEQTVAADVPDPKEPPEEFYRIGPGDVLEVVVWKEKDLSGPVAVRPDGFITLPLINEVQATGRSTGELRQLLHEKYTEFVNNPFVTVRVTKIASSEIFLVGEVVRPNAYPALGNDTLLQLITRAGGLSPFADRENIRVVRREGEKMIEFTIDYNAIVEESDWKQDIILRPGDRVIVP